jgi:two-component system NarL family sensor kinase
MRRHHPIVRNGRRQIAVGVPRPRVTALWSALAVASYVAVSHSQPAADVLVGALLLIWAGVAVVSLSALSARQAGRIISLRQALEGERRARERLAGVLHDESVQTLLVAGQELQDARRGQPGAMDRAETAVRLTIARLREEITDQHPHVLDHAGLEPALEDLARRWSERSGIPVRTRIDRRATGQHDGLIFSVAEALLANVARHASARSVDIEVSADPGVITLRVSDDGPGRDPDAVAHAITERVQAIGGRLDVCAEAGRGTVAVATLPASCDRPTRDQASKR